MVSLSDTPPLFFVWNFYSYSIFSSDDKTLVVVELVFLAKSSDKLTIILDTFTPGAGSNS